MDIYLKFKRVECQKLQDDFLQLQKKHEKTLRSVGLENTSLLVELSKKSDIGEASIYIECRRILKRINILLKAIEGGLKDNNIDVKTLNKFEDALRKTDNLIAVAKYNCQRAESMSNKQAMDDLLKSFSGL
jgi:hypothetical protein